MIDPDFAPFEYRDKSGEPAGFNVDIFKSVMEELGRDYAIRTGSRNEIINNLDNGDIDVILGISNMPERKASMSFCIPYHQISLEIISPKNNPVDCVEAMKDKKIIVEKDDWAYRFINYNDISNDITFVSCISEGINLLSKGGHDLFFTTDIAAKYFLNEKEQSKYIFKKARVESLPYSMAVDKSNDPLLYELNKGLYELKISGEYDKIHQKWFKVYERKSQLASLMPFIIIIIVTAFIFTIFIIILRYKIQKATTELYASQVILTNKNIELQNIREDLESTNRYLEKEKERAEKSDKLKTAFLANMSHEIRTPLNAIIGFSDMLCLTEDKVLRDEYIHIIKTNNNLLLKLIGDILELSKIESGVIDYKYEKIDINEFIDEIYLIYSNQFKKDVKFITDKPSKKYIIEFDRSRLMQIVNNFIGNAIKFTDKGHIMFKIYFYKDGINLYFEDTGTGISKKDQGKIFDRFEKLNNFAQGTGLGLAICKSIINDVKGDIFIESDLGKGTIFIIRIPCQYYLTENSEVKKRFTINS